LAALQQLAEETLTCLFIAVGGHEDVQDVALLIHCSPQVMDRAVDFQEDFIEVPLVAWLWSAPTKLIGVDLAEFETLLPHGFVGNADAAGREEFFNVAVAQ
jgi:hypothetical protein